MKDRERMTLRKLNGTMVKVLLHHVPWYRLRWHRRGRKFNSCRAHQILKAGEKFCLTKGFLIICLQFIFIII